MKLLHDVVHLCATHVGGVSARSTAARTYRVTVPAPLVKPVVADSIALPLTAITDVTSVRREPVSFLKAPRHLRRRLAR